MAKSGVKCCDDALTAYNNQKLGKKTKVITYKLSDDLKTIEKERESGTEDWDTFVCSLPEDKCRYATFDFEFENNGQKRQNLIFVAWCPDSAKIRDKMLFASSKDVIKKKLEGIACEIQANCSSDLLYTDVADKLIRAKPV